MLGDCSVPVSARSQFSTSKNPPISAPKRLWFHYSDNSISCKSVSIRTIDTSSKYTHYRYQWYMYHCVYPALITLQRHLTQLRIMLVDIDWFEGRTCTNRHEKLSLWVMQPTFRLYFHRTLALFVTCTAMTNSLYVLCEYEIYCFHSLL